MYVFAAGTIFYNGQFVERISEQSVTSDFLKKAVRYSFLHDAAFFRTVAEKVQFSGHEPAVITKSFQLAVLKAPGDHSNFFAFGAYAASHPCCRERASLLFSEAVRRKASDPRIYVNVSSHLLAIQRKEEALSYLRRVMEMDSSDSWDIYLLVQRYSDDIEDLIRITPSGGESRVALFSFLASGRRASQEVLGRMLDELAGISLTPEQQLQVTQAARLAAAEETDKTRKRLDQIIKEHPEFVPAYIEMAGLLETISPESALPYLQKAVNLNPANFEHSQMLAELSLRLSRFDEAEKIYSRFLGNEQYRENAYLRLASCKRSAGKPADAILVLRQGIKEVGKTKDLLFELASQYRELGNFRGAAEIYLEYAGLAQEKSAAYLMAGSMYEKAGDYASAKKQYEKALAVDPQNSEARQALSLLQMTVE
jgi:tetratricopeptide (TPR) repeat protein